MEIDSATTIQFSFGRFNIYDTLFNTELIIVGETAVFLLAHKKKKMILFRILRIQKVILQISILGIDKMEYKNN